MAEPHTGALALSPWPLSDPWLQRKPNRTEPRTPQAVLTQPCAGVPTVAGIVSEVFSAQTPGRPHRQPHVPTMLWSVTRSPLPVGDGFSCVKGDCVWVFVLVHGSACCGHVLMGVHRYLTGTLGGVFVWVCCVRARGCTVQKLVA